MTQVVEKIRKTSFGAYMHWCPGCHSVHLIYVDADNHNGDRWKYRSDENGPSFSPEVSIMRQAYVEKTPPKGKMRSTPAYQWKVSCSYSIKNGQVTFSPDCEHEMAGASTELPPLPTHR
jgi:hypothetical protein